MWQAMIDAHEVGNRRNRYPIKAMHMTVSEAKSAREARAHILTWAHIEAKVPPWKPYMRQSWEHTHAEFVPDEVPADA